MNEEHAIEVVAKLLRIHEGRGVHESRRIAEQMLCANNLEGGTSRLAEGVPEGWKLVPIEPTEEMVNAWCVLAMERIRRMLVDDNDCPGPKKGAAESYKAMLAAAPNPPAPEKLICPRCGVDRMVNTCPGPTENCPMVGEAFGPAPVETAKPTIDHDLEAITVPMPKDLHYDTMELIAQFAFRLAIKLRKSEKKYGYTNGWKQSDWMDECRAKLAEHVAKGDPLDVAAYCAFLMWHNEPCSVESAKAEGEEPVATVRMGPFDYGPYQFKITAFGADKFPDGQSNLYLHPANIEEVKRQARFDAIEEANNLFAQYGPQTSYTALEINVILRQLAQEGD